MHRLSHFGFETVYANIGHPFRLFLCAIFSIWTLIQSVDNYLLWVIINSVDLQYPFMIYLAEVKLDLEDDMQFAIARKMAIMNPVIIAKLFHIICDKLFMSIFAADQLEKGFLGPMSNDFATIKINGCDILQLYCLIWLKGILYLATSHFQIWDNNKFE